MTCTSQHFGAPSQCNCLLPISFLNELDESLRSINEVLQALNLFESILDPLAVGGRPVIEMDRDQLSAWLRILNSVLLTRLSTAQAAVTHAMQ